MPLSKDEELELADALGGLFADDRALVTLLNDPSLTSEQVEYLQDNPAQAQRVIDGEATVAEVFADREEADS